MQHFLPADILLPKKDFAKWAVIACDQYTSEPAYWQSVAEIVGSAPSALNIMLPEIYLEDEPERRIVKINQTMQEYLNADIFSEYKNSMIYVERTQADGKVLHGIVGAINLSEYDYTLGSKALIRASEKTVLSRIPPRVAIRKDASLEMPHILLLVDDPEFKVIAPLTAQKNDFKAAYDFELMKGGGHIAGYFLSAEAITAVQNALESLIAGADEPMLFAVGDGNHSLATAKECAKLNYDNPLAQQALVEIVNIHDSALEFEPIYRVLFNCEPEKIIDDFVTTLGGEYHGSDAQKFRTVTKAGSREISVRPTAKLPVGTLQKWLDEYLADKPEITVDYIHGINSTESICATENTLGFIFEGMGKDELFPAIEADGSLPRKTFSMGHAYDKRYYIECRKIK